MNESSFTYIKMKQLYCIKKRYKFQYATNVILCLDVQMANKYHWVLNALANSEE